jgi:hypothetical protein
MGTGIIVKKAETPNGELPCKGYAGSRKVAGSAERYLERNRKHGNREKKCKTTCYSKKLLVVAIFIRRTIRL